MPSRRLTHGLAALPFIAALLLVVVTATPARAAGVVDADGVGLPVHVFGSTSCPLCRDAVDYLRSAAARQDAVVYWHVAKDNRRETDLMFAVAKELGVKVDGYPFIVVGRRAHVGWKGATTGLVVTREIAQVREAGEEDVVVRVEKELAAEAVATSKETPPLRSRLALAALAAFVVLLVIAVVSYLTHRNRQSV